MTGPAARDDHGTRARYRHGCHCQSCTAANREYDRQVRHRLYGYASRGISPWTDGDVVRAHLRALEAAGIPPRHAAALAGVPVATVRRLTGGTTLRMRRATAQRILAVKGADYHRITVGLVDGTGTRRRLQALMACGWSQCQLARRLHLPQQRMAQIMGAGRVLARIARAVRALYDDLWDQPPPEDDRWQRVAASRSRRHAAECGWPPPLAWDDDSIDEPDGQPAAGWRREHRLSSTEIAAEAEELMRQGYSLRQAAERLGRKPQSVEQALSRAARAGAA